MSTLPTLNISPEQIKAELLKGLSPSQVAQEWSEPMANVLAVYRLLQGRGELPAANQAPTAARPSPPTHSPAPEVKARIASATDLLVRADGIQDKRVQSALARARKAMTDLAELVNRHESQAEARAEIADLEERLRAARVALRGGKTRTATRKPATVHEGGYPCPNEGCERVSANPQGAAGHARFCKAAATA